MSKIGHLPRANAKLRRRLALLLFALGTGFLLFPGVVRDYFVALGSPDGIYIPDARYEFSSTRAGTLAHTFRVYNLRPRRLAVRAEPDCGCTGVSWQSATIAPFSWKDLTTRIEVQPAKSHFSVAIALRTDSRARPFLFMFLVT